MDSVILSHEIVHSLKITVLTGVKIPRNKGGHCPFCKSQLDSQMFGMAGPTGLWTHYHLGEI